ncbi:MAG: outer membrane protein assembly factor BamA, partial [Acidobacteriota bacterium]|nr:outer membrane protein assembly factor BamA [Acidobacteriota bacterium]
MKLRRRARLVVLPACLCAYSLVPAMAQQQPAAPQPQPAQQQPAQQQPQQPARPANPFETVPAENQPQATPPATPPAAPPQQPPAGQPGTKLEAPAEKPPAPAAEPGQVIEAFEFRGARRVPQDTLKALILSKPGDVYNEETLRRDFMILWNTGRFDDIRLETEPGRVGLIVRFVLVERRVIRSIDYPGAKSVTVSEILDRFKERKVGLSVESQYDPAKVQRAAVVLKEFLSERGRQYATVDPQIEQIPPSSLKVSFVVNEGPKVKVGRIDILGNHAKPSKWVVSQMKNSKPIGLPHSVLFENMFAKTFDRAKLDEDKERIRQAYQDAGYFQAKTLEDTVDIQQRGGSGWRLPLIRMQLPGISADIKVPVEEGRLYHLRNMNFQGVKLFRTPEVLMKPLFGMTTGDVFSTEKLRKGIENMRNLYGEFGYIDFVPEPNFDIVPDTDQIDLTLTADEGKQFFIRRIDFSGNTTTRDKVIRREIMLDEGDMFNTELWDLSILRLNQLGYFEMLKKEDAADIRRNP